MADRIQDADRWLNGHLEVSERLRDGAGNRQSVFEKTHYAVRWELHTNLYASVLVLGRQVSRRW